MRDKRSRTSGMREQPSRKSGMRQHRSRTSGMREQRSRKSGMRQQRSRASGMREQRSRKCELGDQRSRTSGMREQRPRNCEMRDHQPRNYEMRDQPETSGLTRSAKPEASQDFQCETSRFHRARPQDLASARFQSLAVRDSWFRSAGVQVTDLAEISVRDYSSRSLCETNTLARCSQRYCETLNGRSTPWYCMRKAVNQQSDVLRK